MPPHIQADTCVCVGPSRASEASTADRGKAAGPERAGTGQIFGIYSFFLLAAKHPGKSACMSDQVKHGPKKTQPRIPGWVYLCAASWCTLHVPIPPISDEQNTSAADNPQDNHKPPSVPVPCTGKSTTSGRFGWSRHNRQSRHEIRPLGFFPVFARDKSHGQYWTEYPADSKTRLESRRRRKGWANVTPTA